MKHIKTLAPTLTDALIAVEQGCRKVQNDPHFIPDMLEWMIISEEFCKGCLATCTLMQLTGKSATDIVTCFDPESFLDDKALGERAAAFGLHLPVYSYGESELARFEKAINDLRQGDFRTLLQFYGLDSHINANLALEWLDQYDTPTLGFGATTDDLLTYADFIKEVLIPKVTIWFF
jgi:hypothetical protein